jgi:hypothetical protein
MYIDGNCKGCLPKTYQCRIKGEIKGKRFAFEAQPYPGPRLIYLDKTYKERYNTSLIENLDYIKKFGVEKFIEAEEKKRTCPECKQLVSIHEKRCRKCFN